MAFCVELNSWNAASAGERLEWGGERKLLCGFCCLKSVEICCDLWILVAAAAEIIIERRQMYRLMVKAIVSGCNLAVLLLNDWKGKMDSGPCCGLC